MADSSSFRSAFKGFNREDVISYISELMEKISAGEKNAEELRQRLAEAENEADGLRSRYADAVKSAEKLEEDVALLTRERDEQARHCAALERRCAEFDSQSRSSEVKLGAAMMDAKRFSEMLVKEANERVGVLYHDAYEMVTASSAEANEIERQMKDLAELFDRTMAELRRSMRDLTCRMAAFGEEVKDNGAKFDYRSDFADDDSEGLRKPV